MSEWTYIGMAYGATWLVVAVYIAYTRRRLRRAEALALEAGLGRAAGGMR